jgi:hypothetical protein
MNFQIILKKSPKIYSSYYDCGKGGGYHCWEEAIGTGKPTNLETEH